MLLGQSYAYPVLCLEAHAKELFCWCSYRGLELLDAIKELRMNQGRVLPSCLLLRQTLKILDKFESGHRTVRKKYGTSSYSVSTSALPN